MCNKCTLNSINTITPGVGWYMHTHTKIISSSFIHSLIRHNMYLYDHKTLCVFKKSRGFSLFRLLSAAIYLYACLHWLIILLNVSVHCLVVWTDFFFLLFILWIFYSSTNNSNSNNKKWQKVRILFHTHSSGATLHHIAHRSKMVWWLAYNSWSWKAEKENHSLRKATISTNRDPTQIVYLSIQLSMLLWGALL